MYGAKLLDKCVKKQKKFVHRPLLQSQAKQNGIHQKKEKTDSTFLIQFFTLYNFAFCSPEIPQV